MGRGRRIGRFGISVAALALTAAPTVAQDATTANNSAASEAIIGPQLRDFNLNGTVTRQAAPPPATTTMPVRTSPVPPATTTGQPPARPAAQQPAVETQSKSAAGDDRAMGAPPATTARQPPTTSLRADPSPATVTPLPTVTTPPGNSTAGRGLMWPWILAALLAAGGALFVFWRHQQRHQGYAVAAADVAERAYEPAPQPEPVRRAPVTAPLKPAQNRIVSTRLRPDLEIQLLPERAVVDEQGATIEFQVAVRNNGSAPARDVKVEACMVNAGPAQDQELGAFFARPDGKGSPIGPIPPMSEVTLKSAVRLPIEHMRQFEIAGRRLFVPIVGLNALYRGPAGTAQTSASYLVGRDGNGEKMAPFRLDLGPRIFRGLGARQHTATLRT